MTDTASRELPLQEIDEVIIRFAGDSGDGMQLTGDQFTSISAALGNDLSTLPEFPPRSAHRKGRWQASRRSRCGSPTSTSRRRVTRRPCWWP